MATRYDSLRTLKMPIGTPDHFTIEQARAAVLAVMRERGETPVPDVIEEVRRFQRRRRSRRKFHVRCPLRRKP